MRTGIPHQDDRSASASSLGQTTTTVIWSSGCFGRVAEWQTRWLQVPVSFGTWGFKSPFAHCVVESNRMRWIAPGISRCHRSRLPASLRPCSIRRLVIPPQRRQSGFIAISRPAGTLLAAWLAI